MPKKDTADNVKLHTEAKLQFYILYLERYLAILLQAKGIKSINIYDIYSGAGIYKDRKKGSAVRAVEVIEEQKAKANNNMPIKLLLNDLDESKVEGLKKHLVTENSSRSWIDFNNKNAADLLGKLPNIIRSQPGAVRNLVFIDPYGYKDIDPQLLSNFVDTGMVEIILFLPVEVMHRFLRRAYSSPNVAPSSRPLKKFVDSLGINPTSIKDESDFVANVCDAFSDNDNDRYCTSYSIRNHRGRLYALFCMTSNLLGLEKFVEVKWKLDSDEGKGFRGKEQIQGDFFLGESRLLRLETSLRTYLENGSRTNADIRKFVLIEGFLPKHARDFLKDWQKRGWLSVCDATGVPVKKGTFHLGYNSPKQLKFEWHEQDRVD